MSWMGFQVAFRYIDNLNGVAIFEWEYWWGNVYLLWNLILSFQFAYSVKYW